MLLCVNTSVAVSSESESSSGENTAEDIGVSRFSTQSTRVAEKNVTFYASYGFELGQHWHIPFKLWISEPPDTARRLLGKSVRSTIRDKAGIKSLSDVQKGLYKRRVEDFIADSESREAIVIAFDGDPANQHYPLTNDEGNASTDRNGNLEGVLILPKLHAQVLLAQQKSTNGWLRFSAVSDDHAGTGMVRLIAPTGTSIISDIDDTIKDTGITKGHGVVLENTFFNDFEPVPCMAKLYASFGDDAAFHYVSGAPWQLYRPLVDFLFAKTDEYPWGSLHMKNVRTNLSEKNSYKDIWKLLKQGSKQVTYDQKIAQITQLIKHFPVRQFILIGDSGERDPEVFADIRKRFPAHIDRIIIRDLDNKSKQNKLRFNNMGIIAGDADQTTGCPERESLMH